MDLTINHISKDLRGISLSNDRNFLIESNSKLTVKYWRTGDKVKVEKHPSNSPFSYEINNLNSGDSIICARSE